MSFDRLDLGSARPCSAPTHLISFRPGPYFRNAPNLRFYRVEQRSDVTCEARILGPARMPFEAWLVKVTSTSGRQGPVLLGAGPIFKVAAA